MSQFLPETGTGTPQTDSVGSLLTPATLDISSGDIALMQKVLAAAARNPNLIPSDFMAYLVDYIQTARLSIPIGQVFGYTKAQLVAGRINSDGTIASGTGFSVSKGGTGIYTITFTTPFSAAPTMFLSITTDPTSVSTGTPGLSALSASAVTVKTVNRAGTAADLAFVFGAQPVSS